MTTKNLSILSFLILILLLFTQCRTANPKVNDELLTYLDNNQYFKLSTILDKKGKLLTTKQQLFYRAHCDNAFNDIENSEKSIKKLFKKYHSELTEQEKASLLEVQIRNYIRTFQYDKVMKTSERLLAEYSQTLDSTKINHYKNTIDHYSLLTDTSPSSVIIPRNNIEIESFRNEFLQFIMVPTQHKSGSENFLFDTGAEHSVITNTTAKRMGLEVIQSKTKVESSNEHTTEANIAIADSLYIGNILLKNVVFLVMPLPAIPELDFYIHGIIGMPEIMNLGAIKIKKDGSMVLSADTNPKQKNIFFSSLDGMYPIVQVENDKDTINMILDSGANSSTLSGNYYNQFKTDIISNGDLKEVNVHGVAGKSTKKYYSLPNFKFRINGNEKTIETMDVSTEKTDDYEFDGTIGEDMLIISDEIIMDFKKMYIQVK